MCFPNLAWAMAQHRIVQYQIARALGISEGTLSVRLRGRVQFAPHEKARIAELVGYQAEWLFAEIAPPAGVRLHTPQIMASSILA